MVGTPMFDTKEAALMPRMLDCVVGLVIAVAATVMAVAATMVAAVAG
jgi:hypothetical protein